jgi:molybdenum cofactor cytidylyltransferase
MKPTALIVAAGYSSRMGEFKPLLPIGGRTTIERAIDLFRDAGLRDVIVVTGFQSEQLNPVLRAKGVRAVFNPQFDDGMFSSIRTGVRALAADVDACFVLPADIALVRPLTIDRLLQAGENEPAQVIYPVFQKRRGHPPLIRRPVLDETLASDEAGGLRALLARHAGEAIEVDVIDEAIHLDIDTPQELARAREVAQCRHAPSAAECREILRRHQVDDRIVRHSGAVAEVSRKIAASLPHHDSRFDFAVLRAGSLLHDMAKGQPEHACVAADILEQLRFPRVARVIACHGDLDFSSKRLDDAAIVYLADKLVRGERTVLLRERFEPALQKFSTDPAAMEAILRRLETAEQIVGEVERESGKSLQEILGNES